jgi:hypothetical protein
MSEAEKGEEVYQLHICLEGISPMIWRRILIHSDSTLEDLHNIIQITMDWSNYYLHQFSIRGKEYAVSRMHLCLNEAREITLSDLRLRLNERFLYEYSFFEWWQHRIRLEKRYPVQPGKIYPFCSGGSGAPPPEDCGGVNGFMRRRQHFSQGYILSRILELLQYFRDDTFPDDYEMELFQEEFEVFSYWLDVDKCDRRTINRRLKWYAAQDERWMEGLDVI